MRYSANVAAAAFSISIAFIAMPADAQSSAACDQFSGYEAESCLNDALTSANDALNSAYKKAETFIDDDQDTSAADKETWKSNLVAAERAWILYRDANCKFELIGAEWHNGSGTTAAQQECVLAMTTLRTDELNDRYSSK